VLRLASVLWRLRRATTMQTGLFEIQAEHLRDCRQRRQLIPNFRDAIHPDAANSDSCASQSCLHEIEVLGNSESKSDGSAVDFARCFLRLANLPNFTLDRLSRYETSLWRQAGQILYALDALDRRKPQERSRFYVGGV